MKAHCVGDQAHGKLKMPQPCLRYGTLSNVYVLICIDEATWK